jgi:hypothetical protein
MAGFSAGAMRLASTVTVTASSSDANLFTDFQEFDAARRSRSVPRVRDEQTLQLTGSRAAAYKIRG